ncbi:MAG: hypothetical protein MI976_13925 [Pseudomonadales bacterium]|nr:hypothetical protein [Pseudomonadales bacterium]
MFSFGSLISALSLYKSEEKIKQDRRDKAIRDLYTAIVESKAALMEIKLNMDSSGEVFTSDYQRRKERARFIESQRLGKVALHWAQAEVSLKYFRHEVGDIFADFNKVTHWIEGLKTPEQVLSIRKATLDDAEKALNKLMDEQFK